MTQTFGSGGFFTFLFLLTHGAPRMDGHIFVAARRFYENLQGVLVFHYAFAKTLWQVVRIRGSEADRAVQLP